MKKLSHVIVLLFIASFVKASPVEDTAFTFKGEIKGYGDGMITINYSNPNERVKPDTIPVINDKFILKGSLEAPLLAFTKIMNNGKLKRDYFRFDFMLENSTINFNADVNELDQYTLTGSVNNKLMINIRTDGRDLIQDLLKTEKIYNVAQKGTAETEKLGVDVEKKKEAYLEFLLNYKGYYDSYAGTYLLWLFSKRRVTWQQLETILPRFDESVRNSTYYKYMERKVDAAKRIQSGKMAADFLVKDLEGNEYTLKNFRGHYFLMTFSASWCGPCKLEYPFLRKAYEQYAKKGLKMAIMNVDDSREKWAGDVKEYKFPFPVLSNLEAFTGDLTKNYGVMSIPKVFLIDPKGEIVTAKIRQQRILDKLAEVYN